MNVKRITRGLALLIAVSMIAIFSFGCKNNSDLYSETTVTDITLEAGEYVRLSAASLIEKMGEGSTVTWKSADSEIASVTDGVVLYKKAGKTTVTAEVVSADGEKKAYAEFRITCELDMSAEGVSLDSFYLNLSKSGDSAELKASVVNSGDKIKSWSSSDDTVASVSDGKVTYMAPGRAVITVETELGFKAECRVICDSVVMELGDIKITDSMYGYWMSSYKTQLVQRSLGADDPEMWNTEIAEGITLADLYYENAFKSIIQIIEAMKAYRDMGGALTEEDMAALQLSVDYAVEENGGTEEFGKILSNFYVDEEILLDIFTFEEATNLLYNALFAENGSNVITEDEAHEFFFANYAKVNHVLIDTSYDFDEEIGDYVEVNEERSAEKVQLAKDLYDGLVNGTVTFEQASEYNEDTSGVDSYVLTDDGSYVQEFTDAAMDMKVGEYRMVESVYGIHIMTKYELTEADLTDELYAEMVKIIESETLYALLNEYADDVICDPEKLMTSYDVNEIPLFTDYMES